MLPSPWLLPPPPTPSSVVSPQGLAASRVTWFRIASRVWREQLAFFGTDGTGKCIANPMATSPDGCQLIGYTQSLGESCDMVSYCETGLKCTNGVFGTGKCAKGESPVPKMPARTLAQASLIVSRVSASLRLGLPVESFESRVELAFICLRSFRNSIKSGWSYYKHYPLPTEDQHKTGDD